MSSDPRRKTSRHAGPDSGEPLESADPLPSFSRRSRADSSESRVDFTASRQEMRARACELLWHVRGEDWLTTGEGSDRERSGEDRVPGLIARERNGEGNGCWRRAERAVDRGSRVWETMERVVTGPVASFGDCIARSGCLIASVGPGLRALCGDRRPSKSARRRARRATRWARSRSSRSTATWSRAMRRGEWRRALRLRQGRAKQLSTQPHAST
jgi:hypothetical protein